MMNIIIITTRLISFQGLFYINLIKFAAIVVVVVIVDFVDFDDLIFIKID